MSRYFIIIFTTFFLLPHQFLYGSEKMNIQVETLKCWSSILKVLEYYEQEITPPSDFHPIEEVHNSIYKMQDRVEIEEFTKQITSYTKNADKYQLFAYYLVMGSHIDPNANTGSFVNFNSKYKKADDVPGDRLKFWKISVFILNLIKEDTFLSLLDHNRLEVFYNLYRWEYSTAGRRAFPLSPHDDYGITFNNFSQSINPNDETAKLFYLRASLYFLCAINRYDLIDSQSIDVTIENARKFINEERYLSIEFIPNQFSSNYKYIYSKSEKNTNKEKNLPMSTYEIKTPFDNWKYKTIPNRKLVKEGGIGILKSQ